MTARELNEWWEYWIEEPFGQIRSDHVMAALVQFLSASISSHPLSFDEIIDGIFPTYRMARVSNEEDRRKAAEADLARVRAMIASGAIIDKRKQDVSH